MIRQQHTVRISLQGTCVWLLSSLTLNPLYFCSRLKFGEDNLGCLNQVPLSSDQSAVAREQGEMYADGYCGWPNVGHHLTGV